MELLHKKGHYNFSNFKEIYIKNYGIHAMQQFTLNAFYVARQNLSITFLKQDISDIGITNINQEFKNITNSLNSLLKEDSETLLLFKQIKLPLVITLAEDINDYVLIIHEKQQNKI